MKKKSFFVIAITTLFAISPLATILGIAPSASPATGKNDSCTTVLVGKNLTTSGNVIHAHNEDLWFNVAQNLKTEPGKTVNPGSMEKFFYTSQPYGVSKTLSFMGSFNFNDVKVPGDLGLGVNEKGVLITTNTAHARPEEIVKQKAPFIYSDFMRYALERANTAEEGVHLVADMLEKHGMSGDPGMIFFISDVSEAWALECTPLHWTAVKCPDDSYIERANQYGVLNSGDLRSSDLIQYAINKGWYNPQDNFNFREVYGDPDWNDNGPYEYYNKYRETFIKDFMSSKLSDGGKVSAQDMMSILRSHFEGTDYVSVPPHARQNYVDYTGLTIKRTICTARTVISLVAEQDDRIPVELNKIWVTFPAPCTTGYFPIYLSHVNASFPKAYNNAPASGASTPDSNAWWAYAQLISSIDKNYTKRSPVSKQAFGNFEQNIFSEVPSIESQALSLYNSGNQADANKLLNNYTDGKAMDAFDLAKYLFIEVQKIPQK